MTTIRQLITGAMRLNRVVAANETPTDSDMQVGVDALRSMLDSMQADLLNIYTTTPRRFMLTPGQQSYTLGPALDVNGNPTGADWVTERPVRVERAVVLQYPSVVSATQGTILEDTFTGTGQLINHTPEDGGPYLMTNSTSADPETAIVDGVLRRPAGEEAPGFATGTSYFYNQTVLPSAFTIEYDLTFDGSTSAGLILARNGDGWTNGDRFADIYWDGPGVDVEIYNAISAETVQTPMVQGQTYAMRHDITDTGQSIYIDGVLLVEWTYTSGWFSGYLGFGIFDQLGNAVARVDNLRVYA